VARRLRKTITSAPPVCRAISAHARCHGIHRGAAPRSHWRCALRPTTLSPGPDDPIAGTRRPYRRDPAPRACAVYTTVGPPRFKCGGRCGFGMSRPGQGRSACNPLHPGCTGDRASADATLRAVGPARVAHRQPVAARHAPGHERRRAGHRAREPDDLRKLDKCRVRTITRPRPRACGRRACGSWSGGRHRRRGNDSSAGPGERSASSGDTVGNEPHTSCFKIGIVRP
jgi:hypothetical protein